MIPDGAPSQRFADEMGALLGPQFPQHLILAVSGGGDSMAMLYLAAPWARRMGITLYTCTINHNLRPEAAQEAALVAQACAELGLHHQTLDWHWDGAGNLQDAARQARLDLINRWRGAVTHVAMAHTRDDQAETVLMRLARGSGVDGLAAIPAKRQLPTAASRRPLAQHPDGPPWPPTMDGRMWVIRPLLTTSRAELRHYNKTLHIPFADDPSNHDPKYDRIKIRQSWDVLEPLGLTRERLAMTANAMQEARAALVAVTRSAHQACLDHTDPAPMVFDVTYARSRFEEQTREIQLRLLAAALQFVSHSPYRPRRAALEEALDRALGGGATTLHGGYVYPHKDRLYICPEYNAVKGLRAANGYWRADHYCGDKDVRPLGEKGATQLRDQTDLPARVLWPAPAVWEADRVLGTPRLGYNAHWNASPLTPRYGNILTAH